MDSAVLVDNRIDDGRKLLVELDHSGIDVTVACWVKTSDEGLRRLYIGSTSVEPGKGGNAYGTLYSCLQQLHDPGIDFSDIRLIPATDPIARDALAIRKRYPGRAPIRWNGSRLGDLSVEEVYIYPAAGLMTVDEVLHTIAGLMNRQGAIPPSEITFTNGRTLQAIPLGFNTQRPGGAIRVVLHNITTGKDEEVSAEEIAKIQ